MQLIKKKHTYVNAEGVTKTATQFYLVVEGVSQPIAIDPHYFGSKGSTFNALNLVAKYVGKDNK